MIVLPCASSFQGARQAQLSFLLVRISKPKSKWLSAQVHIDSKLKSQALNLGYLAPETTLVTAI